MNSLLPILIQRMKTESPDLYKRLSRWALILAIPTGIISVMSIESPELLPKTALFLAIIKLCKFLTATMVGVFVTSKTTTTDSSLMGEDTKQAVLKEAVDKGVITATTTATTTATVVTSDDVRINDVVNTPAP